MLTEQNHQSLKHFRARTLIAVVVEGVVVALMMQNREIWFGIPVSFAGQAVLWLITTILLLVYLIRTHHRAMNEALQLLIMDAESQITRVQEAFACAKTSLDKVMKTGLAHEESSQDVVVGSPSPMEFELAYQVRVAIDCIRFSIKATEQSVKQPDQLVEASLQLLDALDRLQSAERSFQRRFRHRSANGKPEQSMKR
jgi:hypothetical protein